MIKSILVAAIALAAAVPTSKSPVADAAMEGRMDAVRILLKGGADVNAPQGDGMTALHWAAKRGDAPLATLLIGAKANVKAVTRIGAYTPLHVASELGHASVITELLKARSDVKALTSHGVSALHLAALSGNAAVIKALLARGAEV